MGARQLLDQAARSGLTLVADGPNLVVRPKERLTDDLRAALVAAKPELMAMLKNSGQGGQGGQGNQASHVGTVAGWDDADIARFIARRDRLMRWGWSEAKAEQVAERLTLRDHEGDDRTSCVECRHHRPGRCSNHPTADLHTGEVGCDLAAMLQRCPGFGVIVVKP